MPSLRELQCAFVGELLENGTRSVSESIVADDFTGDELIRVYRNNLFISLAEALRASYPVVDKLVGEGFFAYMANRFVKKHPSRSGNLHDFGAELADFVAHFEPAASLPYLSDVARLEWARQRAYHAAESPELDLSELQRVPAERYHQLRFRLHPSVGLITSPFPILQIWEANQEEPPREQAVRLDSGEERVLVLRRNGHIAMNRLEAGEHALLGLFMAEQSLSAAVDAALATDPTFDLGNTLRRQVMLGTVVALDY